MSAEREFDELLANAYWYEVNWTAAAHCDSIRQINFPFKLITVRHIATDNNL